MVAAVLLLPAAGCTAVDDSNGVKPRPMEEPARKEIWSIRCLTLEGPNRFQNARNFEEALKKVPDLDAHLVQVFHEETDSALYYGRYERRYDSVRDKELFKPDPLPDLELIRKLSLTVDGRPVWPFALAVLDTWPASRKGQAAWDLNNVDGYWSLQIAVFYNEGEMRERKEAAEKYCRLLREEGVEAYYHHGTVNSSVCVGIFPKGAIVDIQREDPMTGVQKATSKIVDPRMLELQKKYPHNLHNGHRFYEIVHNPRTGERERVEYPSFPVKLPRADWIPSSRSGR